jgi:hypothetical protein
MSWTVLEPWLSHGKGLLLLGGVLLGVSVVVLVRILGNTLRAWFGRYPQTALRPHLNVGSRLIALLAAALFVMASLAVLLLGAVLRTYVSFNRADHIGIVECLNWNPQERFLVLSFTEIRRGQAQHTQTYSLFGDQWEISAHVLKWDPKLNLLGLHTGYRLWQVQGSYLDPEAESERPHRAYALQGGKDWLFSLVELLGEKVPGVEAIYGNAVSRPARAGERYDVFVTTSGLSVRRRSP